MLVLDVDDPDVIIPDAIARPLVFSSFLMLITTTIAAVRGEMGLAMVAFFVFVTSVVHWRKPRFSSWRRPLDYLAVLTALGYGSYLAATRARSLEWAMVWFGGLAAIAVIFVCNETLYYLQLQRKPTGGEIIISDVESVARTHPKPCCGLQPVAPGSVERRHVFRRVTWVHLLCVHVLANALALVMVLRGLQPRT
jgi:hypothetical protein